jgi:hypothetical protein
MVALICIARYFWRRWRRRRNIALLWQQHIQDNSAAGGYDAFLDSDERISTMRV